MKAGREPAGEQQNTFHAETLNLYAFLPWSMAFPFSCTVFSWYWMLSINVISLRTVKNRTFVSCRIYLPFPKTWKILKTWEMVVEEWIIILKDLVEEWLLFSLLLLLSEAAAEMYLAKHGTKQSTNVFIFVGRKHMILYNCNSGKGTERCPELWGTELERRQEVNRQKCICLGSWTRFDGSSSEAARERSGFLCSQAGIPSPGTVLWKLCWLLRARQSLVDVMRIREPKDITSRNVRVGVK